MKFDCSLQQQYAPHSKCFGCGPSNDHGLQIQSFVSLDKSHVYSLWQSKSFHEAFPGVLNGGIIGAILDCHCNWTAAWTLMENQSLETPPCTVTYQFKVTLLRPTDSKSETKLFAKPLEVTDSKVKVTSELISNGKVSATCEGVFVAVKPGHPAFHRW